MVSPSLTVALPAVAQLVSCIMGAGGRLTGFRVYSWSPMETKAFEGFFYEAKKLGTMWGTNIFSSYYALWPSMIGAYALVKWAENKNHHDHVHHRD